MDKSSFLLLCEIMFWPNFMLTIGSILVCTVEIFRGKPIDAPNKGNNSETMSRTQAFWIMIMLVVWFGANSVVLYLVPNFTK